MSEELAEVDFQRFWRRLQQLGLNAYESRSYLVLLGHPRFKALELAARAHVPRQKIYEVLDSLVEKGFAQVVQEKTKLFSAVEPSLAIPGYLGRKREMLEQELMDNGRAGKAMIDDLSSLYSEGQGGRGTLDFLRIVTEPTQTAAEYRRMLSEVRSEYLEFSRPPYAVDPLDEKLVKQAGSGGVACRLLLEGGAPDDEHRQRLSEYVAAGVQVRVAEALPMKLALFDGSRGMIALLDPVITRPTWTAVVFDHEGLGEAMKGLFDGHWQRGRELSLGVVPRHCGVLRVDRVVVNEGRRELLLLAGPNVLRSYRIALGFDPVGHKVQEGDGRTPEGLYAIDWRNPQSGYHLSLRISYPNDADRQRATELGVDPGGDIMIHGLPNGVDAAGRGHPERDWTRGCITVTDSEMEEIWNLVADGTVVELNP